MKTTCIFLFAFLFSGPILSQQPDIREYSYSELFQMIEEEEDTIFSLEDAIIIYEPKTDSLFASLTHVEEDRSIRKDTIFINKEIVFYNVQLPYLQFVERRFQDTTGAIYFVVFNKKVTFYNSLGNRFVNCVFKEEVSITWDRDFLTSLDYLKQRLSTNNFFFFEFNECHFERGLFFWNMESEENSYVWFLVYNSIFGSANFETANSYFQCKNQAGLELRDNHFIGNGQIGIMGGVSEEFRIERNNFGENIIDIQGPRNNIPILNISKNQINNYAFLTLVDAPKNYSIDWEQFSNKIINNNPYQYLFRDWDQLGYDTLIDFTPNQGFRDRINNNFYFNRAREEIPSVYREEAKLLGTFHQMYKNQYDTYSANLVYNELKDLETRHFGHIYKNNPTFKSYFTWKVNQFLKVFSAYGTEPARAIVYSLYVILFFAFIYLFFPNSWDSHGKNRIIDRYTFFLKYMDRKAGIHEVYLEDKKEDLLEYEEFKNIVESKQKKVPRIFTATALPLYKWAISGTKLSSSFLKRVDIIKGTWSDIPKKKRWWKGLLLTGAFGLAILYDLFIKMLNALMLSINTFTTLGFGEIPIKGLPRYLAIIEGFIGWFMLTIFSVSLISQLLN